MNSESPHIGRPSTTRTEGLEKAAEELAPHLSLQRVESTAKFLLGTVSLVGALITGFGAFGSKAGDEAKWLLPSLLLVAAGIVLAVLAVIGSADEVDVDDLEDVDRYYAKQIERRGRRVRLAGVAIAAALLLAVLPAISAGDEDSVSGPMHRVRPPCHHFSSPIDGRCGSLGWHRSPHGGPAVSRRSPRESDRSGGQ